jgi:hypothetical protein
LAGEKNIAGKEKITGNNYLDEIRYYFIELPKFKKTEEELET